MRSIHESRRSHERGLGLALALAIGAIGCSSELPAPIGRAHPEGTPPRRGGIMNLATIGDVRALDPANITDGLAPQMIEAAIAGLVDYDGNGTIVPSIAERWVVEDDGKTYRFFLREGVRFHDGEEVTADDVKRSGERALHPSAPNPFASYFASLVGFDDFAAKKTESLAGIEVEGRYVLRYRLKEPDATFLRVLAMPMLRPVCKSAGARYTDAWNLCGAGPFKLDPARWDHGRELVLVRHDAYFRAGLPYLDGVRWTFHANQITQRFKFERGELDVLRDFTVPDLLRFQADRRWATFGDYDADRQVVGEGMNVQMPPFDNVEIRRAVAAAINRDELRLVRATNMHVLTQPVPPGIWGHDASTAGQRYDYAAALEHMRRAGYPYDPVTKTGGWPEPIPYVVYKPGLQEGTGQILAQQLAKIGIRIAIRVVNYPTFIALRGRAKASALGPASWQADYPDAMTFLEPLFHSRSIAPEDSNNWSFYANPRFDALVDDAHRELDDERRKKLYVEASKILIDDAPWAFTYSFRWYCQWQPYVQDYRSHPVWTHEGSSAWLDRAAGPIGARAVFRRDALAALLGEGR